MVCRNLGRHGSFQYWRLDVQRGIWLADVGIERRAHRRCSRSGGCDPAYVFIRGTGWRTRRHHGQTHVSADWRNLRDYNGNAVCSSRLARPDDAH